MKALLNIINPVKNRLIGLFYVNLLILTLSVMSILRTDLGIILFAVSIYVYWLIYLIRSKYSVKKMILSFIASLVFTPLIPALIIDKSIRTKFNPSKSSFGVIIYIALFMVVLNYLTVNNNVYSGIFGYMERSIEMFKYNSRGVKKVSNQVTVLEVDEATLTEFGWPINRTKFADMVLELKKMGAKSVAFDIIFTDQSNNESVSTSKLLKKKFSEISLSSDAKIVTELDELISQKELKLKKIKDKLQKSKRRITKLEKERKKLSPKIKNQTKNDDKVLRLLKKDVRFTKNIISSIEEDIKKYRTTFGTLKSKSKDYYKFLDQKAGEISPDKVFARALKKANNVVLGYVGFTLGSSETGITDKRKSENFNAIISRAEVKLIEGNLSKEVGFVEFEALNSPYKDIVWLDAPLSKSQVDEINKKIDEAEDEIPQDLMDRLDIAEGVLSTDSFGSFNLIADVDGIARNYYPAYIIQDSKKRRHILYSLGLAALKVFYKDHTKEEDTFKLQYEVNGSPEFGYSFDFSGQNKLKLEYETPYLVLNYYGPRETFKYISMKDILNGSLSKEQIKKHIENKIIIIGATATGLLDLRSSPYNPSQAYPGVEVHATFVENILDNSYFKRPYYFLPLELLFLAFLVIFLGAIFSVLRLYVSIIVMLVTIYAVFIFDVTFFFNKGYLLYTFNHLIAPFATLAGITVFRYFSEEKEKQMVKKTFKYYLSKSVVDEVLKDPSKLALGGVKQDLSVLFSDIRGFTTISEGLTPEQLSSLMNDYLTPMTQCVFDFEGTLDKYMGDAIMAIFGAPISQEDHAMRACLSALKMMADLKTLQAEFKERGLPFVDIGIGVNSGEMSVGNMGSKQRFDYTVLGDNVNLGARLEGINKQYQTNIIISEYTYKHVKDELLCRKLDAVTVKGKNEPVIIYELLSKHKHNKDQVKIVDLTEMGIELYWKQRWDDSIDVFNKIKEIDGNDFLSEKYIERCNHFKASPPEKDWDGSFKMTTK